MALALSTLLLASGLHLFTKDLVAPAVVIAAGVILGIYGSHQPRQLEYRLDKAGLNIGQKYHGYGEFKSFSIVPEGAFASIVFMPLKRFAPLTTVYFSPDDEEAIMAVLANSLPYEDRKPDTVDRLVQRIRF